MNYVNIYGKSFSNDDKEKVLKLMSLIDIPAGAVKFRDVDLGDMNISEKINLCFDNTYKDFAGLFIASIACFSISKNINSPLNYKPLNQREIFPIYGITIGWPSQVNTLSFI